MCPRDCRNDQVHSLLFLCFPMAWYALLWFLLTLNYLISISSNQKKVTLPPLYNCVCIGFHWCFQQERIDAQYNIKLLSFDIKKCIITWISFFFFVTFQMSSHFATFTCFQIGLGFVILMLSAYLSILLLAGKLTKTATNVIRMHQSGKEFLLIWENFPDVFT